MVDVPITPALSWDAQPSADSYTVEIAADSAFEDVVYAATITSTGHTITQPLAYRNVYYWRVRSTNLCGSGSFSTAQMFITTPLRLYLPVMFKASTTAHQSRER